MRIDKKAFTLAEVLVTLIVIGVIAALTIPALLQDIQKQNLRIQWKTAYSIIEQANKRALMDNGGAFIDVFEDRYDFKNEMKSYFSYTKECEEGQSEGNCWPAQFYYKVGTLASLSNVPGLVLNNGMFIRFYMDSSNGGSACTETIYYTASPGECGMYEIDINGFKGPNRYGEDIYFIHVLSNGLKPAGVPGSMYSCGSAGQGCGAYYLRQ